MPIRNPTKEEVTALSEYTGEGRMQCNKELRDYFTRQHLEQASTVEELREVLLTLVPRPNDYIKSALEKVHGVPSASE